MLILLGYMERCCVGFGRTGCTLVLVHVRIWTCHCLVYGIRCNMKTSQLHTRLLFKHTAMTICTALRWCWLDIWDGIAMVSGEQKVRWHADVDFAWIHGTVLCWLWVSSGYVGIGTCSNLNMSSLGVRYTMQHENITIAHSPAIQTHCNDDMHGSALMLIGYMGRYRDGFGWTESTLACLNFNVSLLGIRCVATPSRLHAHLVIK